MGNIFLLESTISIKREEAESPFFWQCVIAEEIGLLDASTEREHDSFAIFGEHCCRFTSEWKLMNSRARRFGGNDFGPRFVFFCFHHLNFSIFGLIFFYVFLWNDSDFVILFYLYNVYGLLAMNGDVPFIASSNKPHAH